MTVEEAVQLREELVETLEPRQLHLFERYMSYIEERTTKMMGMINDSTALLQNIANLAGDKPEDT
jgi:hypothetical protein